MTDRTIDELLVPTIGEFLDRHARLYGTRRMWRLGDRLSHAREEGSDARLETDEALIDRLVFIATKPLSPEYAAAAEAWDGLPPNPSQSGAHWLRARRGIVPRVPSWLLAEWSALSERWFYFGVSASNTPQEASRDYIYGTAVSAPGLA